MTFWVFHALMVNYLFKETDGFLCEYDEHERLNYTASELQARLYICYFIKEAVVVKLQRDSIKFNSHLVFFYFVSPSNLFKFIPSVSM